MDQHNNEKHACWLHGNRNDRCALVMPDLDLSGLALVSNEQLSGWDGCDIIQHLIFIGHFGLSGVTYDG